MLILRGIISTLPSFIHAMKENSMQTSGAAIPNLSGGTGVVYSQAPVGSIVAFAGDVTKNVIESSGWMLCDGRMLNAAQYPLLFAVIGYRYGGSDGQFRIPRLDTTTLSVISDLPEASAPGTRPANAVISQLIRFV